MAKTNYWSWKDSELKAFMEDNGIKLETWSRKEAIALIMAFTGEAEIHTDNTGSKELFKDIQKKVDLPKLMLTRVIFHSTSEQDLPYVPVGHQGLAFYIPREVEVDVPDYILNSCIKDAVEERMMPITEMNGDIRWIKRKVQRFPYSIVKPSFPADEL